MTNDKRDARKAIEDLELDKHLAAAGAAAAKLAQQAVGAAGGFAADHRDQAHDFLGKAQGEIDRVTGGKAQGVVSTVRSGLAAGVDIVAEQAPDRGAGEDPPADPPSSGV
ncbi:hypothetical protein [Janibacter limosus]|uniref:hypothetical protein n=1 Tax=Janibacter limosus TaxID=53458 RepID=UPI0008297C0C|nr:hypothetical protein [Janibacter limosus]